MRKTLAAMAIALMVLMPAGVAQAQTVIAQQSPQKCVTSAWLDSVMCFQINGPNNSMYVDSFEGSLLNLNAVGTIGLNVTILGPSGTPTAWHTTVFSVPCETAVWVIVIDNKLAVPGYYTAWYHAYGGTAAEISQEVHA